MKYTIFISVLLLLFGGCQKCKKEVCPAPTSAKFKMSSPLPYFDHTTGLASLYAPDEDVFLMEGTITFEAEDTTALSYEWKVGNDDRVFKTKKFDLRFKEDDLGVVSQLDIRLIIKKTPASCNVGDNGIDTLVRKVTFVNGRIEPEKMAMTGKYLGYNEDEPNKKFTVELKRDSYPLSASLYSFYIINLLPDCLSDGSPVYVPMEEGTNTSCRFGFPEAIAPFGAYYNCRCLEGGTAYLSNNHQQINIIYKFISGRYPDVVIKPRKFIGKRIL